MTPAVPRSGTPTVEEHPMRSLIRPLGRYLEEVRRSGVQIAVFLRSWVQADSRHPFTPLAADCPGREGSSAAPWCAV